MTFLNMANSLNTLKRILFQHALHLNVKKKQQQPICHRDPQFLLALHMNAKPKTHLKTSGA